MHPRIRAALVCDDVRAEANGGKNILIGVYGGEIIFGVKPAAHQCQLYLAFDVDRQPADIDIEVTFNRTNVHHMRVPPGWATANALIPLNLVVLEPKQLSARVRFNGGRWSTPVQWSVFFSPDHLTLPPEQAAVHEQLVADLAKQATDQYLAAPHQAQAMIEVLAEGKSPLGKRPRRK